jgi:hypothetical protein
MSDDPKRLTREIQLSLGRKLREVYRAYVGLPLHLLSLARRVEAPVHHRDLPPPMDELAIPDREGFDPDTIHILTEAFHSAWNDLRTLKQNPATEDALARTLIILVKEGERNTSRLASRAVLQMIERRS